MNKIIRVIGILILVILILSIPVLFGYSLASPWALYVRLLLGISTIGEIAVGSIWLYVELQLEKLHANIVERGLIKQEA